jgi:hypothetical protein
VETVLAQRLAGEEAIVVGGTFNREIGLAMTGLAAAPFGNIRVLLIYALHHLASLDRYRRDIGQMQRLDFSFK